MKLLAWLSIGGLLVASLCAIVAFALSGRVGLSSEQRVAFFYARGNITSDLASSAQLLADAQPLDVAYESTLAELTSHKEQNVPVLLQCEALLAANYPLMVERTETLQTALDAIDTSPLLPLQGLIDGVASLLGALSTSFDNLGVIETLQQGSVWMSSMVSSQPINLTYALQAMSFPAGARLYFIRIDAAPDTLLLIENGTDSGAQIDFSDWWPPLFNQPIVVSDPPHTDTILDDQRNKIAVASISGYSVSFTQRAYDLTNGRISFIDTVHNFTAGAVVAVVQDLTLNVGFA